MFRIKELPQEIFTITEYMNKELIDIHYNKHHKTYDDNVIAYLNDKHYLKDKNIIELLQYAKEYGDEYLYNNLGQVWNHNFFWQSLSLNKSINNTVKEKIEEKFTSVNNFKNELMLHGTKFFGSGWLWVLKDMINNSILITTSTNGNTYAHYNHLKPLIVIDLWEHAYYLHYKNDKKEFLKNIIEHCLNWNFFEKNLTN